jgi:hypothetical protein
MAEPQATQSDQWWSAFPAPRAKAPEISADEVMQMFDDSKDNRFLEIVPPNPNQFGSFVAPSTPDIPPNSFL